MVKWYFINDAGDVQISNDMNALKHTAYRRSKEGTEYDSHWRRKDLDRISSVWVNDSEVPKVILMARLIGV